MITGPLMFLLSSAFQTDVHFPSNDPILPPTWYIICKACFCFGIFGAAACVLQNKIIRTKCAFEQQSLSSPGTQAINRKCSLTLSHSVLPCNHSPSPPSSLYRSITHSLSGSGFVSGVSMCVVRRDMRRVEMSFD